MTTYVLVPGAWLGGFAWERVSSVLLDEGHDVRPVTLGGLGNRSDETAVSLGSHVDDIVELIERGDLHDVVLVGHSYSGVPVGQAALVVRDRLKQVVYVDADIPHEGRSFIDAFSPAGREQALAAIAANDGCWPPLGHGELDGHDLAHEDIHFFEDWSKPHPGRTLTDPAVVVGAIGDLPTTYVKCLKHGAEPSADVTDLLRSPHWRLVELDTGHWPMWSRPAELAQILLDLA